MLSSNKSNRVAYKLPHNSKKSSIKDTQIENLDKEELAKISNRLEHKVDY